VTNLADLISLIGFLAVGGISILVRKNSNRAGTKLIGSTKGANSDFTSVCNKNLVKHQFLT
jgi:hypothetical protein